jgi:thymidylate kinase
MLKIIIEGLPAAGKTSLAVFIRAALHQCGLHNVTMEDVDAPGRSPTHQHKAMNALREKNPEIVISTRHESRG